MRTEVYRGRFAPSPTGPLHFGSLVAAVGSFLQARRAGGEWLVRMEDIDPPREMPGAADLILRTLEAHGLEWDGAVLYQSTRSDAYDYMLDQLLRTDAVYRCTCSRKEAATAAVRAGLPPGIYPGTCRLGASARRRRYSLRVRTEGQSVTFEDVLQGRIVHQLDREVGDFVVRRADGLYAYQLAVVADDAEQGITEVVRGSDLLDSTTRQIHLQHLLSLPTPVYMHLPVAVNAHGEKLSKQTGAPALDPQDPQPALFQALRFLGQTPPPELRTAALPELWDWAIAHWRGDRIPKRRAAPSPDS